MFRRLAPALLLVVPATAALWAGMDSVHAAEECRARPGSTAPPGSGWYYRISRADHRRCWFLGTKSANSHFTRHRQVAVESTGRAPQEQQAGTQPPIGSSRTEFVDGAPPSAPSAVPQTDVATLDTATEYLVPRIVPTVTFRQPSPGQQTSIRPIVNAAQTMERPSTRASNSTPILVTLGEAAATSLLFVGGSLFLTHLARRRSRRQAVPRDSNPQMVAPIGVPVVSAPPTASKLPDTPPITAEDFTESLRELRRNLRRAEASIQRRFDEHAFSNRSRESAL